ncbi:MAG: ABC transporter permease, partial [Mycobacteriaceae bacterium]
MSDPIPVSEAADAAPRAEQSSVWSDAWRYLRTNPLFLIGMTIMVVMVTMALFPALFAGGVDPTDCDLSLSRQAPSAAHWFGIDLQGCDYYANVVYGARTSVSIGVLTVIGVLIIGVLVGAPAGYFGGWIDSVLARVTDVFFGIPLFLGALILLTVSAHRSVWTVSMALIAFGWMTAMRLVRSSVFSIRGSDYVLAAQALGASTLRILVRHILPNALAPVLIYATIA